MRFLISFNDERKAYACTNYFNEHGIAAMYEASGKVYSIWIIEEDDFEKAQTAVEKFEVLGQEERVRLEKPKAIMAPKMTPRGGKPQLRVRLQQGPPIRRVPHPLTHLLIVICAFLYVWNLFQVGNLAKQEGALVAEEVLTPLQKDLLFDYPTCYPALQQAIEKYPVITESELEKLPPEGQKAYKDAEQCPEWKGVLPVLMGEGSFHDPMFEKIKKGEIWRLITPIFLHGSFLHILFNMAWLFILGKMIEERAGKLRMLALVVITGLISDVAQYLMGGPFFLGFSGVIVGMAGFIWMRQKLSPWEGYPLSQGTLLFLFIFVMAMLALEVISWSLQIFGVKGILGNIANTAHIVGGLVGIVLGRIPFFSRSPS